MPTVRIAVATRCLADYPQGGGVWTWALQYIKGLQALGHRVFLIDLLKESGRPTWDKRRIAVYLERLKRVELGGQCAALVAPSTQVEAFEELTVHGVSEARLRDEIRDADVLWNLAWALNAPLARRFKRSVLLDVDPGVLQVSATAWDMKLHHHNVLMTSGTKINDPDCGVPKLGLTWRPFLQPMYLPDWAPATDPGPHAPVTSVTQWNWPEEFRWGGRVYSDSKRDSYLRYLNIPQVSPHSFKLAANIHVNDTTGDIQLLKSHGWELVAPHLVAGTPKAYARFIRSSRCEFGCAKPIYVDLKTGWFSERSATYLACGRPVIVEDTGIGDHIETGAGLLTFSNISEAEDAIEDVASRYSIHQRAARELADAYFSFERVLPKLVQSSFEG
jgi:hypothetical protein